VLAATAVERVVVVGVTISRLHLAEHTTLNRLLLKEAVHIQYVQLVYIDAIRENALDVTGVLVM
jgi:hypothetical protein|tara:strand:- start:213 stop:404 length:192 start_codon:yes stop_codon:yes gene_type:complete